MKKLLLLALFCFVGSGVYAQKNSHNGHEWVDLGLPSGLKWATCNVGASRPGDYGNYYAWGETRTKSTYTEDNCASYEKSWSDIGGNSSRDAARANWGDDWRLPTIEEFHELLDNCTWEWTTQNGHNGYKVTSKKNGQSIFLPAAGWRYGASKDLVDEYGLYWSSTPSDFDVDNAFFLFFYEDYHYLNWYYRYFGHSVRPVLE